MHESLSVQPAPVVAPVLPATPASRSVARATALCAGLAGLGLLWAVGFSEREVLHDLAHDTRHSAVFPCH